MKLNIPITGHKFATFLGVVHPSHRTKAAIKTLVAATILLVDIDIRSQDVYTLAPRVRLFLKHEIKSTDPIYIQMQADGKKCINACKVKNSINDGMEHLGL